jgi:hypothetical protein
MMMMMMMMRRHESCVPHRSSSGGVAGSAPSDEAFPPGEGDTGGLQRLDSLLAKVSTTDRRC